MTAHQAIGIHAVTAVTKTAPDSVIHVYFGEGKRNARLQKLIELVKRQNLPHSFVGVEVLDQKAPESRHQNVVAELKAMRTVTLKQLLADMGDSPQALVLVLDGVTDPHNLGACLRSANAAGASGVVIAKDRSVGMNDTVRKVASGAAEHTPLIAVTNLSNALADLKDAGFWITGAAGETDRSVFEADLSGRRVLVMGAEGSGLRRLTRENCDELVRIPMLGQVESLNVSVACGVMLFETLRQRT